MNAFFSLFFATPRRTLLWLAAAMAGMLCFGLYLQYQVGLVPCPMCIVQRYLDILVLVLALAAAASGGCKAVATGWSSILVTALAGAFVAGRQSWLQWYPPEFYSCGRDFYGMIEQMPLSQALPKIFAGSGDCTKVDWTFLGGSIANWSFICYALIVVVSVGWLWRMTRTCKVQA